MDQIKTVGQLRAIIREPSPVSEIKILDHLDDQALAFIALSPFAVLTTASADGRGVVCSGDTLTVTMDRKFLSFMRSYPNIIPLPASAIRKIDAAMRPFAFERIYGHYFDRVIASDAKAALERSVARYIEAVTD